MKLKFKILIVACLLAAGTCFAQTQEFGSEKFEVRIGVSGHPLLPAAKNKLGLKYGDYYDLLLFNLDALYADRTVAHYTAGNIGAEFTWNAKKWFGLAGGLYLTPFWADVVNAYTGQRSGIQTSLSVSALVTARFNYFNKPMVRIYSSIGLGLLVDNSGLAPHLQVVPIGVTFGKRVYGFAEVGLGSLYMGGNIGVGYKF